MAEHGPVGQMVMAGSFGLMMVTCTWWRTARRTRPLYC